MIPTIYSLTQEAISGHIQGLACAVGIFAICCVPIWGLAVAIFKGYPGQSAAMWIFQRWPQLQRMPVLEWEIRYQRAFDVRVHLTPGFYVPRKLSPGEVRSRRNLLRRLTRATRWQRRALYLLNCQLCQCFWIALIVLAIASKTFIYQGQLFHLADLCLSAIAHSTIIAMTSGWRPWKKKSPMVNKQNPGRCGGGCGGSEGSSPRNV